MSPTENPSRQDDTTDPSERYRRMLVEIQNSARARYGDQSQPSHLWKAAFRDGFYDTLAENPGLSAHFLLITDRGPTWHYQNYDRRAGIDHYDDVFALVALSALINDALH